MASQKIGLGRDATGTSRPAVLPVLLIASVATALIHRRRFGGRKLSANLDEPGMPAKKSLNPAVGTGFIEQKW